MQSLFVYTGIVHQWVDVRSQTFNFKSVHVHYKCGDPDWVSISKRCSPPGDVWIDLNMKKGEQENLFLSVYFIIIMEGRHEQQM